MYLQLGTGTIPYNQSLIRNLVAFESQLQPRI